MKIKQQKQIKTFLQEEFGEDKGSLLFDRQEKMLNDLISTAKMEKVPGFYTIYSHIFLKIMRTTDLWESVQEHDKNSFDASITKCLWHTACVENGCEKLCRLFCDVDDVTYGGLRRIGFTRTKTLGYGGDCCDFHFYKK